MILDTNVFLNFSFQYSEQIERLIADNQIYAPSFLRLEVVNILRKHHFFNGVSLENINFYEEQIFSLITAFVPDAELFNTAKELSFLLNHPIYDCLFLALALETSDTFATYDQKLAAKAASLKISTIDLNALE
jgi:predicted nucleic acid-binding protein